MISKPIPLRSVFLLVVQFQSTHSDNCCHLSYVTTHNRKMLSTPSQIMITNNRQSKRKQKAHQARMLAPAPVANGNQGSDFQELQERQVDRVVCHLYRSAVTVIVLETTSSPGMSTAVTVPARLNILLWSSTTTITATMRNKVISQG